MTPPSALENLAVFSKSEKESILQSISKRWLGKADIAFVQSYCSYFVTETSNNQLATNGGVVEITTMPSNYHA